MVTEAKVLYKGKEGNEGKQEAARDLGKENSSVNQALDNDIFHNVVNLAKAKPEFQDGAFDIDKQSDREAMRTLIKGLSLETEEEACLLGLLADLDNLMKEKITEIKTERADAKREVDTYSMSVLADLNADGKIGAVKNERKNARNTAKDIIVEDRQGDIEYAIYTNEALANIPVADKRSFIEMAKLGKYQGVNFAARMRKDYIAELVAEGGDEKDAADSFASIEKALRAANQRDDLRKLNRFEKKSDRIEMRVQRSREKNAKELNINEGAINNALGQLKQKYGADEFAKMLDAKIQKAAKAMGNVDPAMICFETESELVSALADETKGPRIREIFAQELKFLGAGSLEMWLTGKKQPEKKEVVKDAGKLTAEEQKQIDDKVASLNLPAEAAQRVKPYVAGAISSYFTGLGAGLSYDLRTKMIDAVIVGAGMSTTGVPGFMVDFQKSIELGKNAGASITMNAGLANAVIPFARVDLEKVLNNKALFSDFKARAQNSVGVYGEIAGPYVGAGVRFESNYSKGVDKAADNMNTKYISMLDGLKKDAPRADVIAALKKEFTGAEPEDLTKAADLVLSGLAQDYTSAEIAGAFTQAWQNEKIKKAQGHVDVTAEVGAGVVGPVPVLKAFIGLGFYRGATIKENKESRRIAKEQEQVFDHADKIDSARLLETTKTFFDGCTVEEKGDLITVTQPEGVTRPIYKQFAIYINKDVATIDEHSLTFSKNSATNISYMNHADERVGRSFYIGFAAGEAKDAFSIREAKVGNPETVKKETREIKKTEKTTAEVKTESTFDMWEMIAPKNAKGEYDQEFISFIAGAFNGQSFIDITKTGNPNKLAYNKAFGQFIDATTTMNDSAMTKALIEMENKMGGKSGITNVLNKWSTLDASHKLYAAKMLIQTASHSAKVDEILNDADGKVQGKKGQLENIGALLMDRSGHEKAFANAGLVMPKGAFDAIYEKAKNINKNTDVSIVGYQNAVSLVGYYRNGLTPTVGVLGLGSVQIIDGPDYRQSVDKKGGEYKAFMDTYMKSAEAAQQKAILMSVIKEKTGRVLDDEGYKTLLTTGKFHKDWHSETSQLDPKTNKNVPVTNSQEGGSVDITLPSDFFKALNGPCANESYILNFGDLNIKTSMMKPSEKQTTITEVVEPDHTMAVDAVTGGQNAKKVNVGLGFSVKQETIVNKPKSGTRTDQQNGNGTNGTENGDGNPVDTGNGADDIPGSGSTTTETLDPPAGPTVADPTIKKTIYSGGAAIGGGGTITTKRRGGRGAE